MARARTYVRDNRGRFASSPGGGGGSRPKARMASRGANRLTRDNAGKITSVGGTGATARGGRLRTASGKQRGAVMAKAKGGAASSTIVRGGRGVRGSVARSLAAVRKERAAGAGSPVRRDQGEQRKRAEQRALKSYTRANNQLQRYTTSRLSKRRNTAARAVAFLRGEQMPPPIRKASPNASPKAPAKQRKTSLTAPKGKRLDEKTRDALKGIAGRTVDADNRMISNLARSGKISRAQASKVFNEYVKRKLIKRQGIDNVTVKNGALMDRSVIRGALKSLGERPAPLRLRSPRSKRPANTIAKPKGLKSGTIKPAPRPSSKLIPRGQGAKVKRAKPAGAVVKPAGLKPGALAERRGVKAGSVESSGSTINRTRAQAIKAQRARNRGTIEQTRGTVIGMPRTYTQTAGGGKRLVVRKAFVKQSSLFGGTDNVVVTRAKHKASQSGPAPGSRSARRRAGASSRKKMSSEAKRMKTLRRVMGAQDLAGHKTLSVTERRAGREGYRGSNKRRQQSEKTKIRAAQYLDARRPY